MIPARAGLTRAKPEAHPPSRKRRTAGGAACGLAGRGRGKTGAPPSYHDQNHDLVRGHLMADPFNRLLIRPADADLLAAVQEAAACAPTLHDQLPLTQGGWARLLDRTLVGPEGRAQWEQPHPPGLRGACY